MTERLLTSTHLFAGGGGDACGFDGSGFGVAVAVNHVTPAVETLRAAFPSCDTRQADITKLDFRSLPRTRVLVGSPICKEVSPAGSNRAEKAQTELTVQPSPGQEGKTDWSLTRMTAYDLLRAAEVHDYDVVCGENVPRFATTWRLFDPWLRMWAALDYHIQIVDADAAFLADPGFPGVPQHRRRLLFCFTHKRLKRQPDLRVRPPAECRVCGPVVALQRWAKPHARKIVHGGQSAVFVCPNRRCGHLPVTPTARPLADVLEPGLPTRRIGDGKYVHKFVPYAEETRRKVEIGLRRFGGAPFIVVLRRNCTVLGMDEPLGTITAEGNHFAYIEPAATVDDSGLRMLSIREKARAQGFDDDHPLRGTGTEKNRLIGNAVPVTAAGWMSRRVAEVCS